MDYTQYLHLSKPDIAVDHANIDDLNANMDIIDTALHEASQSEGQVISESLDGSTDYYTGCALFAQGGGTLETPKHTSNVMLFHTEDSDRIELSGYIDMSNDTIEMANTYIQGEVTFLGGIVADGGIRAGEIAIGGDELRADSATGYFGSIITSSIDCSTGHVTGYSGYFDYELHGETGYFDNLYVNGEPVSPGGGFDGYFPDPVYFQDTITVDNYNHSGSIKFTRTDSSQTLIDFTGYHDTGYITGVDEIATLYFAGSSDDHNYIGYLDSNNIDVTGDITKTVSGTTHTYRTIEANPSGTALSTLSKVEIGGTLYNVGSSSSDHYIYPEYPSSTFTGYLVMAQSDQPQTPIMSPDFYLDPSDTLILGGSLGMSVGGSIHGYSDMTCEGNMSAYTATISTLNDDMHIASGYAIYDDSNNPLVSVEANPSGTATDTLTSVNIGGTVYDIGGGNVYGAFIDTNRVIQAETSVGSSDTYTATQDCMVVILLPIGNHNTYVYIDGVKVINMSGMANIYYDYTTIPLKEGQVMTFDFGSTNGYITVYGLTFGTQNIFTPQIYSTEEREVGVWIDNKPLYQKTVEFGDLPNNTLKSVAHNISNLDFIVSAEMMAKSSGGCIPIPFTHRTTIGNQVQLGFDATNVNVFTASNQTQYTNSYVTIRYTKTTDTAGSGSYNTLGVPMVHYTTDEQVIGTAEDENGIIKPLYEKMTYIPSLPNATETEYSLGITNIKNVYYVNCIAETSTIALPLFYNAGNDNNSKLQMFMSDKLSGKIKINTFNDNRSSFSGTVIIRYTKTTD